MFGLLRRWRRSRLRKRPMPPHWLELLEELVPFYPALGGEDQERFLNRLKVFVWEKVWIEAGGMQIDDTVKVVVSAAAVRLGLHLNESVFNRLTEIVVYPSHYHHPDGEDIVLGEAHAWGTVVLSWDAVIRGIRNPSDGHDTATHEFAHVLDRNTGRFDGTPELRARSDYHPWALILSEHYDGLRAGKSKQRRFLRDYGATNEAEFFAVATEAFFEKSQQMFEGAPKLYTELSRFYGFDPAAKLGAEVKKSDS